MTAKSGYVGAGSSPPLKVAAGVLCGVVVALTLRTYGTIQREHGEEVNALLNLQEQLVQEQQALLAGIDEREAMLLEYDLLSSDGQVTALRTELIQTQRVAGLADMSGPGVEVVLDDAPREAIRPEDDINYYIVHDVDVLRVVNLLRGAGAECISINGERLLSNSRIRCGGPTIRVKDRPLAAPFSIRAIGDPQALSDALTQRAAGDGMSELEILRFFGVRADVVRLERVEVPRYVGELTYRYAEAVE